MAIRPIQISYSPLGQIFGQLGQPDCQPGGLYLFLERSVKIIKARYIALSWLIMLAYCLTFWWLVLKLITKL